MKSSSTIFLFLFFLIFNYVALSQSFDNVSPKDNSVLVSLKTNIILKSSEKIDAASLSSDEFSIVGSVSGEHQGSVKLSDDNKTILFLPATAFSANENVIVNAMFKSSNLSNRILDINDRYSFIFHFITGNDLIVIY